MKIDVPHKTPKSGAQCMLLSPKCHNSFLLKRKESANLSFLEGKKESHRKADSKVFTSRNGAASEKISPHPPPRYNYRDDTLHS
ncbi:MAG: hypothetical protein GX230_09260 [Lentisphaerae bacterium]|nr:hypothetical protein [Lentisphaerota bacterium]